MLKGIPKLFTRRNYKIEGKVTVIFFLAPSILIFAFFVILPIILSSRYSFYSWNGLGVPSKFIGIENYLRLLHDQILWKAFFNNCLILLWSIFFQLPFAFLISIILAGKLRGKSFFRTLFSSPIVLSGVIVGLLWQWIYNPTFGLANSILTSLGMQQFISSWLGNTKMVMLCILIAITWRDSGFYIIFFTAAIENIPDELYCAAKVDGANTWQLHTNITLPQVNKSLITATILTIISSMQYFDLIWIMTQGGPYHASEVLATYMFENAFQLHDWGYATALAFTILCITMIIILVMGKIPKFRVFFGGNKNE